MPDLGRRCAGGGVDLVAGQAACGAHLRLSAAVVGEEAGGHRGASGVVDADEQDAGFVSHGAPRRSL